MVAQAALTVATPRNHLHELLVGARTLLADFYPTAQSFKKQILEQRVLRHNVASEWARLQGLAYVEAGDLFCGSICHPSFTELCFKPAVTVRSDVDEQLKEKLLSQPFKATTQSLLPRFAEILAYCVSVWVLCRM